MTWVGSFKSLQTVLPQPRLGAPLRVHTWLQSEIDLISPFVDSLISLIAQSRSLAGVVERSSLDTAYLRQQIGGLSSGLMITFHESTS